MTPSAAGTGLWSGGNVSASCKYPAFDQSKPEKCLHSPRRQMSGIRLHVLKLWGDSALLDELGKIVRAIYAL